MSEQAIPPLCPTKESKINFKDSDQALDFFMDYISTTGLSLYPAQEEAILQLFTDENVILTTPTGSGKSLVATALHFWSLVRYRRSVYTCPIKALVNEKFLNLCSLFGPENVGLITGDAKVNSDAPIICCTAEILSNDALRNGDKTEFLDVVMDEFHYYGDEDRGVAWQIPLLTMNRARFLLMSATMGDPIFFVNKLNNLTGLSTSVISSQERPVPLDFNYLEDSIDDAVGDLISAGKSPIYVVAFTQRECAENAQSFLSTVIVSKDERKKLSEALKTTYFSSPYGREIKRFLSSGIGVHHAGLLPKYRILVEKMAQKGLLKVICGTDTLGVGVNVPIRSVLFTKLCKFNGQKTAILSARDFHQIAGRAGRRGFDTNGSVYCIAPAHVVENKRLEQKAALNPKLKKKMVKSKPPTKGFVNWSQETFFKLVESQPERLRSKFRMSHSMMIQVLSRPGDSCKALKEIVRSSHESDAMKVRIRKRSFQLFRSLKEGGIVEIEPAGFVGKRKVRLNIDLQDDFSLSESLSVFLLACLPMIDPFAEDYTLQLLSLVESIIENPRVILTRQLDKAKRELLNQLRSEGVDYSDRINQLDDVEYPKPMADYIYESYNHFSKKHPWIGEENIRPKSIAREMFENYMSFHEYIKEYGLEKAEGVLLRYLSSVFRVLQHTIPFDLKNDSVDDMIAYFEVMIRSIDSSLVDEWQKLRYPGKTLPSKKLDNAESDSEKITRSPKIFEKYLKASALQLVRPLALKQYERFIELSYLGQKEDSQVSREWDAKRLEKTMLLFYSDRETLRCDSAAISSSILKMQRCTKTGDYQVSIQLLDEQDFNDWEIVMNVDYTKCMESNFTVLELISVGPIGNS